VRSCLQVADDSPALEPYSAIDHLAQSLNRWDRYLFGMFTGYFDDAGGADHGYTVVAGWVSSLERWRNFAEEWRAMLSAFRVPHFDMKTLSHFKGVYAPWKDDPKMKDQFQDFACRIIAGNVLFGWAQIVEHSVFEKVNGVYQLREYVGNEYALAGVSVALKMRDWVQNHTPPEPFEIVFDDGTAKRGKLVDVMRREHFAEPIFRSPVARGGFWPVVQLQAADFLAYEVRKVRADDPNESRPIEDHRISLRKLIFPPNDWGTYKEDSLMKSCEQHPRIERRTTKK